MEGFHCFPEGVNSCDQTGLELPIVEYIHTEGCNAVIGGHVYRGDRVPALAGAYIYGDFCKGTIWGLRYDGASVIDHSTLVVLEPRLSLFGVDENQELYLAGRDGKMYQFVAPEITPEPVPGVTHSGLAVIAAALSLALFLRIRSRDSRTIVAEPDADRANTVSRASG
jgi:hypothetical protein